MTLYLPLGAWMTDSFVKNRLDDLDLKILDHLETDGRITHAKLASRVGLSAPSLSERVKKLERAGVIRGYKAIVDAQRKGRDFFVFVAVNVDVVELSKIDRLEQELARMPQVQECHHIAGDIDFLLKVNVGDSEQYKQFVIDHLAKIKGISRIHSWVVLSTIKDIHQLILPTMGESQEGSAS